MAHLTFVVHYFWPDPYKKYGPFQDILQSGDGKILDLPTFWDEGGNSGTKRTISNIVYRFLILME
jgi:hypothetical protein